jgi:hypothetical protein
MVGGILCGYYCIRLLHEVYAWEATKIIQRENDGTLPKVFVGFAYQGKDIVFRFIIDYSGLGDFGP